MVKASEIEIFNPLDVRRHKARSAKNFEHFDFLHQWAMSQFDERLSMIRREFKNVLHIGGRGSETLKNKFPNLIVQDESADFRPHVIASPEFAPYEAASFDLILSALDMHAVNDLPGALLQIRKSLKPDGLFLGALFGGETLHELRTSLTKTELSLKNGASPRVSPFADKQQMGALMQRAGFALPVIDSEIITVTYDHMFKLMHDLRGMGETNAIQARSRINPGKAYFMEAANTYQQNYAEDDGRIPASFEIIFVLGWSPHASQQKPLKPGSAEKRLAEALNTEEIKTS
jgi:NADH dehydrogenase [ubiquinone] 1 alpha subcomplex assembly factor 5